MIIGEAKIQVQLTNGDALPKYVDEDTKERNDKEA